MPSNSPVLETGSNSTIENSEETASATQLETLSDDLESKTISSGTAILATGFENSEEKVIREDVLQCLSRKQKYYRVVLTSSELLLQLQQSAKNRSSTERYSIEDLFGCHTLRHKQHGPSFVSAYVCFYLYPRRKRQLLSKIKLREKVPLVFEIRKPGNSYEENLQIASTWKEDAIKLIQKRYPKWQARPNSASKTENEQDCTDSVTTIVYQEENNGNVICGVNGNAGRLEDGQGQMSAAKLATLSLSAYLSFVKKYMVIINPVSGQGKGKTIFNQKVLPILLEAGVKVELLITSHAGHAKSVVGTTNLSNIDGILTVGGDGLLYEVVNGLRGRTDWEKVASIPLGVIASGSGNGLARSIAQYSKEDADYLKNPVLTTALAAARGKVMPVNLMEIEMDGTKSFAFLSVGWGLLSDIDVESEVLRAIGEPRFTIWAFLRLAKLRSYKAQLTYVPCESVPAALASVNGTSPGSSRSASTMRSRDPVTLDTEFISVYSSCQSYIGTNMMFAPGAQASDGLIHLTYLTKDGGRTAATPFLLGIDNGSHLSVNGVTYVTVKEFCIRAPAGGFNGTVTVDGENVNPEEIRVKISPQPLYVYAL